MSSLSLFIIRKSDAEKKPTLSEDVVNELISTMNIKVDLVARVVVQESAGMYWFDITLL